MKTVEGSSEYKKDFKIPVWEGLCHGWAPATLSYLNPGPITVKGIAGQTIKFGSSDLMALLTYNMHHNKSEKTNFLGSRCNLDFSDLEKKVEKGEKTQEEMEEQMNSSNCADTNAGAFHIVLSNQLGKMDQGFVINMTRDVEVWNQPVFGFKSVVLGTKSGASVGACIRSNS